MMSETQSRRGITLVEIMVTLAVLGVLMALAAPSLADLLNRRRVQAVAEQISADIAFARAETGLRQQDVEFYFQGNSDLSCYSIAYTGNGGSCECTNQTRACLGPAEFKTSRVPASIGVTFTPTLTPIEGVTYTKFSFERPRLTPSSGGFGVAVNGARGAKLQVQVNAMGRVSICTPDGSMPGAQAC